MTKKYGKFYCSNEITINISKAGNRTYGCREKLPRAERFKRVTHLGSSINVLSCIRDIAYARYIPAVAVISLLWVKKNMKMLQCWEVQLRWRIPRWSIYYGAPQIEFRFRSVGLGSWGESETGLLKTRTSCSFGVTGCGGQHPLPPLFFSHLPNTNDDTIYSCE